MADNNTIARPYAQACFELAREQDTLERWSQALAAARDLLADGQVARYLATPALDAEQKFRFLTGLFDTAAGESSILSGGDRQGSNFLRLLLENGRVNVLPEIAEHFEELKAQVENTLDVTVTSATALSDAQKAAVTAALTGKLGRDVNLVTETDENLIGGAVIRAGDVVIDGSLRSRLEDLSNALIA
jgi:F-type H+-transporting ATPase subunit delta